MGKDIYEAIEKSIEEFDHLERMYDSAESNIESRENFLTETIGLLTSISGGFKKIFIDFLATKNLEFQEFISERDSSKIEIYTQISYKNKYKGSNKPDIILHYANDDVVLIENKVDSNDIDNLKDKFFEILYKYSKAVEREPKFIEQFKDMVKVFQDVDHYYKKIHKKHLNKTEMNMILRKPMSYQLIIKLLAKQ